MLNSSFSKTVNDAINIPYVAPDSIANRTIAGNESFDTKAEYRLQSVYAEEIWLKLARAGLPASVFAESSVLEVCAGTGFLTHHLLSRCSPMSLTVNDISAHELDAARQLVVTHHPQVEIEWALGDMHKMDFKRTFDIIIGNSFIHHFHDVPQVLSRFYSLLEDGGIFISLHEPTPMCTVVEGAKLPAYPLAVLAPILVNDIARSRFKGEPSTTDLWMFDPAEIKKTALNAGFSRVDIYPWHLLRSIFVQKNNLHLSAAKPKLTNAEVKYFSRAIRMDALLSRFLSNRFFGSICLVCHK